MDGAGIFYRGGAKGAGLWSNLKGSFNDAKTVGSFIGRQKKVRSAANKFDQRATQMEKMHAGGGFFDDIGHSVNKGFNAAFYWQDHAMDAAGVPKTTAADVLHSAADGARKADAQNMKATAQAKAKGGSLMSQKPRSVYKAPNGDLYESRVGSKAQVWHGTAFKTSGGLKKSDLVKNKRGKIVSKRKSELGKKQAVNLKPLDADGMKALRAKRRR